MERYPGFAAKVRYLHGVLKVYYPGLARISVVVFDAASGRLRTFFATGKNESVLAGYESPLKNSSSLEKIVDSGQPRIISNLKNPEYSDAEHNKQLLDAGFLSSYTMPIFLEGEFCGFVFFNAQFEGYFKPQVANHLNIFGHLVALLLTRELAVVRTLRAAVSTARLMAAQRDGETGAHLDRMAYYSRIIAKRLALKLQLTDEQIEYMFLFAPLHDIGKISIPDSILMKPGRLNSEELRRMRKHVQSGVEIINALTADFGLQNFPNIQMLSNIVLYHHEAFDGSGYPEGLAGEQIPIEARIVSAADIFDALTSRRSYKDAWDSEAAFGKISEMVGTKLDHNCVQALVDASEEVASIQANYEENPYG